MGTPLTQLHDRIRLLRQNSLVSNAFFLMLSTFVVAASGFLFWVLVTKHFSAAAVGLATSLLSISNLLALLGLAGFDSAVVRFLPGFKQKNDFINSSFIVVTVASLVIALGLVALLPRLSPSLSVLYDPGAAIAFVFFTITTSLNILAGALFLAFKKARYTFLITMLFCTVKVVLAGLVAHGNAVTIFVLAGAAQLVGVILNLIWIRRKYQYRFSFSVNGAVLRLVRSFSLSMYGASILNLLPPTLLPLVILHTMAPQNTAYYYMAFTIASVLYTVAYASMQSAFAEGSHDHTALKQHITKAIKIVGIVLLPAAALTWLLSGWLLQMFGQDYAQHATGLLQLFAYSAAPVAMYSALGAIFKVTKNLRAAVMMNVVYAAVIIGMSYWLIPRSGIIAVGWAWLAGNLAACAIGGMWLLLSKIRYAKSRPEKMPDLFGKTLT